MAALRKAVYSRRVIAAAVLAGAVLLMVAAGLGWAARLLHIGGLDAQELAEKLAVPEPRSALDWPELRLRAAVPEPGAPARVLLLAEWPEHPDRAATLLVDIADEGQRSLSLLSQWCEAGVSVSPTRHPGAGVELRRRQSLERVYGCLLAENAGPAAPDRQPPGPASQSG
jgi:hypothetical protein